MTDLTPEERDELLNAAPYSCIPNEGEMRETYEIVERLIAKYVSDEKAAREEAVRKFEQQVEFRREYERMAEKAEQERDELAQRMWDAYTVLGFDTDGDETPAAWIAGARSHARFARQWLAEVKQARRDRDEMTDECVAAEARVAELEAGIAELKSRGCYPAVDYTASGGMVMDAEGRALTEKGAE